MSFTLSDGKQISLTDGEVAEALQYSPTPGLPDFVEHLSQIQIKEHAPQLPRQDWSLSVNVGSQDGLWRAFEMLIEEGDNVLVDQPTYSGALSYLKPMNANLIGVASDGHGLIPSSLRAALLSLPRSGPKKPRVLYTIPTGQNPAGSTCTIQRKEEIYRIACEHDLIIMEDDPYWWLHYGDAPMPLRDQDFLRPVNRSLWSMDTEGRVLRFDSFSKVLSSGLRLGFVTGPTPLINQLNLSTQATLLHASGIAQQMSLKLLRHWADAGWNAHTKSVALYYGRRRDAFIAACNKHLTGLAEWTVPSAGMFVWFKLPGITDTKSLIEKKAVDARVIMVFGQAFDPSDRASSYVRASFSLASDNDMDIALGRFATLLRNERASSSSSA